MDTIAAISTANAVSAIGILRLSGPEAFPIVKPSVYETIIRLFSESSDRETPSLVLDSRFKSPDVRR